VKACSTASFVSGLQIMHALPREPIWQNYTSRQGKKHAYKKKKKNEMTHYTSQPILLVQQDGSGSLHVRLHHGRAGGKYNLQRRGRIKVASLPLQPLLWLVIRCLQEN
jgi:hypothetical protein